MMFPFLRPARRLASGLALLASLVATHAQTLTLIRSSAPPERRINFVVLSEGYTTSQLATFRTDATNIVNAILNAPPFSLYRSCFNAYAISVASNESGSDHADQGTFRDTYFSTFYTGTGNPKFIDIPAAGLARVNSLLASLMPQCDVPIVLVNDLLTGGSGGAVLICNKLGAEPIVTHELGHTLAGLGDEYETPFPGHISVEEPNTTQQTNRNLIKWKAWIDASTPVPTPANGLYDNYVGLFQGANYQSTGWYRPKATCRMRDLNEDFCEVCKEALVLSIYRKARPINSYSPATNFVVSLLPEQVTFTVGRIPAPSGTPVFQWTLNNVPVANATGTVFNVSSGTLSNGLHTVRVEARDATTLVRTDPTNRLRQTNTWQLQVNLPSLRVGALRPTTTNGFGVQVTGNAAQGIVVEASTNLTTWQAVATNDFGSGNYLFREPLTNPHPRRYYRARTR